MSVIRSDYMFDRVDLESKEGYILPSDEPFDGEGLIVGFTKDTYTPIKVPFNLITYHFGIIGASGFGKTTLLMFLLYQQMMLGGGFIFGDAKIDYDTSDTLGYWARKSGREDELYIINFDNPDASNTYNPIIEGDANEVASRLMSLMPSSSNNAGADHYRSSVMLAVTTIISALKVQKQRYTFLDLSILLQSGEALNELLQKTPVGTEERVNLEVFLDKYRNVEKTHTGNISNPINAKSLKDAIGGLGNRIGVFAQGKFGKVMNTYTPEIDLYDIIRKNKMLYIMLPTMAKNEEAIIFMKMLIGDLRSAIAKLQKIPKSQRPKPPFLVPIDEFGPVAMESITTLFEQARSAGVGLLPGFQAFGQLEKVATGFQDIILQNMTSKAYFKFGSKDSAEEAAGMIGMTKRFTQSFSVSEGSGDGAQTLRATPQSTATDSVGTGETYRQQEEYRVTPDQLKAIPVGDCILQINSRLYHLLVPRLESPIDNMPIRENFKPFRHEVEMPYGESKIELSKRYKDYLTEGVVKRANSAASKKAEKEREEVA
ncbi:MAG: type IV secretion system DNA-binding domain-containing protein [Proteobacteria bacterium]|nr:type IV secretion system DNA-binding domain-containing protein [Pseudomonadota bacterium]